MNKVLILMILLGQASSAEAKKKVPAPEKKIHYATALGWTAKATTYCTGDDLDELYKHAPRYSNPLK